MTFKELVAKLQDPPSNNPDYYNLLIENARVIIVEVAMTSKQEVAEALCMSAPKFAISYPLFKALARTEDERSSNDWEVRDS